jgi:hypothetical protein
VGLGLGAGVGTGLGEGAGEGAGVGDGVGWGAAELVVPAHPPSNSTAETTADKTKAVKPILDVKRMVPPKQSWRVRAELLCLHREATYLPVEKRVTPANHLETI